MKLKIDNRMKYHAIDRLWYHDEGMSVWFMNNDMPSNIIMDYHDLLKDIRFDYEIDK